MRTLIVGLGNPILSDDGIGIRVVQAARQRVTAPDVDFLEASLGGLRLAEQLEGYQRAIIVDAIQTRDGKPGALYRLTLNDIPSYNADGPHDASLKVALELFRRQGGQVSEQITIIAIEVVNLLDFGETFTPEVAAALPAAVEAVLAELARFPSASCEVSEELG